MTGLVKEAFLAASNGDAESLVGLLDQGVPPDSIDDENGETLIGEAARQGRFDCLALLLQRGADANGVRECWPPLWAACSRPNNAACIRELIKHGANVNPALSGDDGYNLLMHCAAEPNLLANLRELLCHSPVLDSRNKDDESALSYAIAWGNIGAVELLLDAGVDPNVRVCNGETALMVATSTHNETTNAIVQLLLDRGADVNVVCEARNHCVPDMSPLMTFVRCQSPTEQSTDVLRRMTALVKNINYETSKGETALKFAQDAGFKEYVNVLLQMGARSND